MLIRRLERGCWLSGSLKSEQEEKETLFKEKVICIEEELNVNDVSTKELELNSSSVFLHSDYKGKVIFY
jgi:hypothetical protein